MHVSIQKLNRELKGMLAAAESMRLPEASRTGAKESSNKFKTKNGHVRSRTFSGPPDAGRAKTYSKHDFTHNDTKLMLIASETKSLVGRLQGIYSRQVVAAQPPSFLPCHEPSAGINRHVHRTTGRKNVRHGSGWCIEALGIRFAHDCAKTS